MGIGAFGMGREDYKEMTPIERSMADLSERRPVLNGPNRDTFINDAGKCFVMGREVSNAEYDKFMEKYNALIQHQINSKEEELKEAA